MSGRIAVLDRVTMPRSEAMSWLEGLRVDYLPGAEVRGLRLSGSWWTYAEGGAIEVVLLWEAEDLATLWKIKQAIRDDRSVDAWWDATDAIAISRHRQVCVPADGRLVP